MPFTNFVLRLKTSGNKKFLYLLSMALFFWSVFDGTVSYVTPLKITEGGVSKTAMGLIYSSSSIAGAFFDFILSKFLKNTHYRRLFLLMFGVCAVYPLLLWAAKSVLVFVVAMCLWGLYFDLQIFGTFDFVSRRSKAEEHASSFGIIAVFKSLGYLIAPILAGMVIGEVVGFEPFAISLFFLLASFFTFVLLSRMENRDSFAASKEIVHKKINILVEIHLWQKIGRILLPVLVFTMMLNVFDAFFWTIGPLYSENFRSFEGFGGWFMATYTLPTLFMGWLVGSITGRFGKKRTAFATFLFCCLLLLPLPFLKNPYLVLAASLLSATMGSLAWPSIKGAFVDYTTEAGIYEREIEGLGDFFSNIGYVIGPAFAGFLSDKIGNSGAFFALGLFGAITSLILLIFTPRKIILKTK